jgi:hypothetical protein
MDRWPPHEDGGWGRDCSSELETRIAQFNSSAVRKDGGRAVADLDRSEERGHFGII